MDQYRSRNDQLLCLVSSTLVWLDLAYLVRIFEAGAPKVLENSEGARTTPSVVAFTKGELAALDMRVIGEY